MIRAVGRRLLEDIAKQYPKDSPESNAIADAAAAFIVVRQHESLFRSYQGLKATCGGELNAEMIAKLRAVGIEPSEFDDHA